MMVNFKLGEEIRKDVIIMSLAWDKEKKVRHKSLVVQWLEHPTGVQKVTGSIPVGDSDFFLCP